MLSYGGRKIIITSEVKHCCKCYYVHGVRKKHPL